MKIHLLAVALLPAAASAQFSPISPRINPLAGLPTILPAPSISPLSGGIQLPTPMPALTPSLRLAPALSAPAALTAPAAAPLAVPAVAADPAAPVRLPLVRRPAQSLRLSDQRGMPDRETEPEPEPAYPDGPQPEIPAGDQDGQSPLFDGSAAPGRHISLPEWDLERELGL